MRNVDSGAEMEEVGERKGVEVDVSTGRFLGIFTMPHTSQVKGSASAREQPGLRFFTSVT
jgi:hypothetical protein